MRILFILILPVVLLACAAQQTVDPANPDTICRDKGLEVNSVAYKSCVSDTIRSQCAARGHQPGSDEFSKCQDEIEKAAFTRQQLQLRGY